MNDVMNTTHLLALDDRLGALLAEVDAAGRSGQTWFATWRRVAPELLEITGPTASHPRLRDRRALDAIKARLLSVWLRGTNPRPLPTCEWEQDDAAVLQEAGVRGDRVRQHKSFPSDTVANPTSNIHPDPQPATHQRLTTAMAVKITGNGSRERHHAEGSR